jgi:hypothetical protein
MKTRRVMKQLIRKKKVYKMINLIDGTEGLLEKDRRKFKNKIIENFHEVQNSDQEKGLNLIERKNKSVENGDSSQTEKYLGLKRGLQSVVSNNSKKSKNSDTTNTERGEKKKKFEKNKSISGRSGNEEFRDITEIRLESSESVNSQSSRKPARKIRNKRMEGGKPCSIYSDCEYEQSPDYKSPNHPNYQNLKKSININRSDSRSVSVYSLSSGSVSSSSNFDFNNSEDDSSQEDSSFKYRLANKNNRKETESISSDSCSDISAFSQKEKNINRIITPEKLGKMDKITKIGKIAKNITPRSPVKITPRKIKKHRKKYRSNSNCESVKSKKSKNSDSNYTTTNNFCGGSSASEDLQGDIKFDKVKRITSAKIVDPQNKELSCFVEFEQRPDGYTPPDRKYSTKLLKDYAPAALIDFLTSRICVNKTTFN